MRPTYAWLGEEGDEYYTGSAGQRSHIDGEGEPLLAVLLGRVGDGVGDALVGLQARTGGLGGRKWGADQPCMGTQMGAM